MTENYQSHGKCLYVVYAPIFHCGACSLLDMGIWRLGIRDWGEPERAPYSLVAKQVLRYGAFGPEHLSFNKIAPAIVNMPLWLITDQ